MTWKNECPLHGLCTECGLEFSWRDIVNPLHAVPHWFYEHALQNLPSSLIRTWCRSLRPWSFWRDIRMPFRVRTGRLVIFVFLAAVIAYLLIGVLTLTTSVRNGYSLRGSAWMSHQGISAWISESYLLAAPFLAIGTHDGKSLGGSPWAPMAVGMFFFTPLAFLALPITLRQCRVQRRHLVRGGAYSFGVFPLILLPFGALGYGSPLGPSMRWWLATSPSTYFFGYSGGLPLVVAAWLFAFWSLLCSRYLKLPHAATVAFAMCLIGFLIVLLLTAFLHPEFTHNPVTSIRLF